MSVLNPRLVRRIHRGNAILLSVFIAAHVCVNLSAWGGADLHRSWNGAARAIYQMPVVEAVLVLAVLAQVVTGLSVARARKRADLATWSGLYLALFLLVHTSAAIGTRRIVGLDTDYDWAAGSLTFGAVGVGFTLYYGLAVVSLCVHLGTAISRGWSSRTRKRKPRPGVAILVGVGLSLLILLPFSPYGRDTPIPDDVVAYYHKLYGWTGQVPGPVEPQD